MHDLDNADSVPGFAMRASHSANTALLAIVKQI
jgi:hypothetical protein